MKEKYIVAGILASMVVSGCSAEDLDSIDPSINDSWEMRLTTDGLNEYQDLGEGGTGSDDDEDSGDDASISKGDPNETPSVSEEQEDEVISSTLTDDMITELNKIDAGVVGTENIPIVNGSQVHAAMYVDRYLNPKVQEILNQIQSDPTVAKYPSLCFKVAYRGLDMTDGGEQKWITYSKSYQNLGQGNPVNSDEIATMYLLSNWNTVNKTMKSAYSKAYNNAIAFGEATVVDEKGISQRVKNCSQNELIKYMGIKSNAPVHSQYILHYLNAIDKEGSSPNFGTYQAYLNAYESNLDLSYGAAVSTAEKVVRVMPSMTYGSAGWSTYTVKENSYDQTAQLVRRQMTGKMLSSICNTSMSKNTNMGKNSMHYSKYSKYGGSVYYFENGNHKLSIVVYGDDLWKAQNDEVRKVVEKALSGFKGPQNFTSEELKNMIQSN